MLATSVLFLLVGLATVASGDIGGLLVGIAVVLLGGWFFYGSWRSGVFVSEESVVERAVSFGASTRMNWVDVAAVEIGPGPSLLPSGTVVLTGKDGIDDMSLDSLSWYSFRPSRVPRRVAEFQRMAEVLMGNRA